MVDPTRHLCRVLRERDALRARMAANDRQLTAALREWSHRVPGDRGGIATEYRARAVLRQAGLL